MVDSRQILIHSDLSIAQSRKVTLTPLMRIQMVQHVYPRERVEKMPKMTFVAFYVNCFSGAVRYLLASTMRINLESFLVKTRTCRGESDSVGLTNEEYQNQGASTMVLVLKIATWCIKAKRSKSI